MTDPHARPRFISRRDMLFRAGQGFGGLALAYLLNQERAQGAACDSSEGTSSPFSPKQPHFKPRAKS